MEPGSTWRSPVTSSWSKRHTEPIPLALRSARWLFPSQMTALGWKEVMEGAHC